MRLLSDINVFGKRVFVRADLDVPLREAQGTNGECLTTNAELEISTRLTNLKPTVDYLLEHAASQILIAGHIDRPSPKLASGKPIIDPKLSTEQILPILEKILGREIDFYPDLSTYSKPGLEQLDKPGLGGIILLENLRFWSGETKNDPGFAQKLASMADIYVNEAFGNCHRNHTSMVALPQLLPHAAGLHLQKEIEVLEALLKNPKRPFVAIVGGAKIETKLPVIENLAKVADSVLVGGEIAKQLTTDKKTENMSFVSGHPFDKLRVTLSSSNGQMSDVIVATLTPDGKDIDEASIERFKQLIASAKTIVWNGPMGVFEEGFEVGSMLIAQAIIDSGAYSVVGGGETTEFLGKKGLLSKFLFVSSGGGAMLEFLSGKKLPALQVLE